MPSERNTELLNVHALKVRRGETEILKGINWTVQAKEHWAILGANGCGKTSLLAAIHRTISLTPPTP